MSIFNTLFNQLTRNQPEQQPRSIFGFASLPVRKKKERKKVQVDKMTQMKLIYISALRILQQKGVNIQFYLQSIRNPQFSKGQNFQAILNANGQIQGKALYYNITSNADIEEHSMFFGLIDPVSKIRRGEGIQVIIQICSKGSLNIKQPSFVGDSMQSLKIYLLQDWDPRLKFQSGYFIYRKNQTQIQFEGQFENLCLYEGSYKFYRDNILKLIYKGKFLGKKFHGKGVLTVNGKHIYQGNFERGKRDGYGKQQDLINKTIYLGEFQNDRKNGFGELIYTDKDNMKLRGFWCDNFMKPREGIYLEQSGKIIQVFQQDDQ